MFGNLFSFLQPRQVPEGPFGCIGSCEGTVLASGVPAFNTALAVLAGAVGTWGYIEQWKLQRRMVNIAERAADVADGFYDTSLAKYNEVDLPAWQRLKALYERYRDMAAREDSFINCAFSLREYCPDTSAETQRATTRVNKITDHADAYRSRLSGRNCTTTAAHHSRYRLAMNALLRTATVSAALQYEEQHKREMDQWYWQRWKDGANFIMAMGDRAVRALIAGAGNVSSGLNGIGQAVNAAQQAAAGQGAAIANQAQFWGNIAQGGMNGFGQAVGAGYFSGSPAPAQGGWTTTVTPSIAGSLKD